MNMNALIAELTNDPLGVGYATMRPYDIRDSMNAETRQGTRNLTIEDIHRWSNDIALEVQCEDAKGDTARPAGLRQACYGFLRVLNMPLDRAVDVSDPQFSRGIGALQTAGLITAQQLADLNAMANTQISRCAELGIGRVNVKNITDARRRMP